MCLVVFLCQCAWVYVGVGGFVSYTFGPELSPGTVVDMN